jgi:hypothetical protein
MAASSYFIYRETGPVTTIAILILWAALGVLNQSTSNLSDKAQALHQAFKDYTESKKDYTK